MSAIAELERPKVSRELLDRGEHFEIVNGEIVELPPMSSYAARVASRIVRKIGNFTEVQDLGEATQEELYCLPLPNDRRRRPDVAYTSYERWAKDRLHSIYGMARNVVPDFISEVISPTDDADDLFERI